MLGLTNSDFLISDVVGASVLFGNTENDSLISAGPGDTVYGGQDDDFLVSRAGRSLFFGDLSQDRFEARGSLGQDTVFGGTDNLTENREQDSDDIFNFGNAIGGSNLGFGNGGDDFLSGSGFGQDTLWGGIGDDTLQVVVLGSGGTGGGAGGFVPDTVPGFSGVNPVIVGGAIGSDVSVVGAGGVGPTNNPGRNYLSGDKGNDVVFGVGDRDTLSGGVENDTLFMLGQDAPIVLSGTFADPTQQGQNLGTQLALNGVPRNNLVHGGLGDDSMWSFGGARGRQTLFGAEGDDTLVNLGTQVLAFGNTGADYLETRSYANSTLYGGQDGDTVVSGQGGNPVVDSGSGSNLLYGDKGSDTLLSAQTRDTLYGGTSGTDADTVAGANDDVLSLGGGTSIGFGNKGDDSLIGTGNSVTLYGGEGSDTLTASGISSYLSGDKGNDSLWSSGNNSTLYGGADASSDTLLTAAAGNTLLGGEGDDSLLAILRDNNGNILAGGNGTNSLIGGEGNDILIAGKASDTLLGGAGDDSLVGSAKNDLLRGDEPGRDFLEGFKGTDTLVGESGQFDGFVFRTPNTGEVGDTITSATGTAFETGTDKFYLEVGQKNFNFQVGAGQTLRSNIDFVTTTSAYTGSFTSIAANSTLPSVIFQDTGDGGFLLYDANGADATGGLSGVTTIAAITSGEVNFNDIVLF
ncbi:calcium-binding protein [Phormidium sp. CCY1219]|uniref:calcium-binding protein n=1 Tax=Phormidium sp. CCY1219 TaxID=2886104 RepID=UPI002D1E7D71|nr:calcium-binding protein [Phormidium sp. CCY1219]MEB3830723.1 hypothetical protein [Phormidium sp. CCY1219]